MAHNPSLVEIQSPYEIYPSFQITETQAWLSEMAEKGLFLKKTETYTFYFEEEMPKNTLYRIEPVIKDRYAAQARKDRFAEAGFEFVAEAGDFNIFRAPVEKAAQDVHADIPALAAVYKERVDDILAAFIAKTILFFIVVPAVAVYLISIYSGFTLPNTGVPALVLDICRFLLKVVAVVYIIYWLLHDWMSYFIEFTTCRRYAKSLMRGIPFKSLSLSSFFKNILKNLDKMERTANILASILFALSLIFVLCYLVS